MYDTVQKNRLLTLVLKTSAQLYRFIVLLCERHIFGWRRGRLSYVYRLFENFKSIHFIIGLATYKGEYLYVEFTYRRLSGISATTADQTAVVFLDSAGGGTFLTGVPFPDRELKNRIPSFYKRTVWGERVVCGKALKFFTFHSCSFCTGRV